MIALDTVFAFPPSHKHLKGRGEHQVGRAEYLCMMRPIPTGVLGVVSHKPCQSVAHQMV